jgi:hypothetical protein
MLLNVRGRFSASLISAPCLRPKKGTNDAKTNDAPLKSSDLSASIRRKVKDAVKQN